MHVVAYQPVGCPRCSSCTVPPPQKSSNSSSHWGKGRSTCPALALQKSQLAPSHSPRYFCQGSMTSSRLVCLLLFPGQHAVPGIPPEQPCHQRSAAAAGGRAGATDWLRCMGQQCNICWLRGWLHHFSFPGDRRSSQWSSQPPSQQMLPHTPKLARCSRPWISVSAAGWRFRPCKKPIEWGGREAPVHLSSPLPPLTPDGCYLTAVLAFRQKEGVFLTQISHPVQGCGSESSVEISCHHDGDQGLGREA